MQEEHCIDRTDWDSLDRVDGFDENRWEEYEVLLDDTDVDRNNQQEENEEHSMTTQSGY